MSEREPNQDMLEAIEHAAAYLAEADGLLITAGAGLGVDSGLPDFRGAGGFWAAYPALGRAQMHFQDIANPQAFIDHPRLAWGFYGHRLEMYRQTTPGASFALLKELAAKMEFGAFVVTSNVDGHFQTAGFPARDVWEVHGSIHHLQCIDGCMSDVWSANDFMPVVDAEACLLKNALPACPWCAGVVRPNILMFGDWGWLDQRSRMQEANFREWRAEVQRPVVVEIGAGSSIPTIRRLGEMQRAPLIRINPHEAALYGNEGVSMAAGGTVALRAIVDALRGS